MIPSWSWWNTKSLLKSAKDLLWSAPSAVFFLNCPCLKPAFFSSFSSSPPIFSPVLRKGQVVTGYYRWLQRRGGYLWIQSTATVSINHKAPHERNVIWVNYVLRSVKTRAEQHLFLTAAGLLMWGEFGHADTMLCTEILWRDWWWNTDGLLEEFLSLTREKTDEDAFKIVTSKHTMSSFNATALKYVSNIICIIASFLTHVLFCLLFIAFCNIEQHFKHHNSFFTEDTVNSRLTY